MTVKAFIFSKESKVIHTAWFALWPIFKLDINLLTLVVSLEAIYLELFLGDNQGEIDTNLDNHHADLKAHITNHLRR